MQKWVFPPQHESIEYVVECVRKHLADDKAIFLFSTYNIGKERLLRRVAQEFRVQFYADARKLNLLQIMGEVAWPATPLFS